jgi:alpha/beta superfamily hydrolase
LKGEVLFQGDHQLQGLLELPESNATRDDVVRGGVVVAHPHPLYGGTMANPVVYHVARACRARGLATLRFNFRGVGGSGGHYGGGIEHRDVRAAAAFLRGRLPEGVPLALAGYSFGAWMSVLAVKDGEAADALALVAFPVVWEEMRPEMFQGLRAFKEPVLAVSGSRDEIAPPAEVEVFLRGLGLEPRMRVMNGEDHFFMDGHDSLGEEVSGFLARAMGAEQLR